MDEATRKHLEGLVLQDALIEYIKTREPIGPHIEKMQGNRSESFKAQMKKIVMERTKVAYNMLSNL